MVLPQTFFFDKKLILLLLFAHIFYASTSLQSLSLSFSLHALGLVIILSFSFLRFPIGCCSVYSPVARGADTRTMDRRSNWFPQERNFKFWEVLSNWERDALLCSDVDKYFFCKNTCENFSHNVSTWTDPSDTPTTFPDEIKVEPPVWFRNFVLLLLWRDGSCNEISFSKIQLVGSNSLKAAAAAKEISHRRKGGKKESKKISLCFPT